MTRFLAALAALWVLLVLPVQAQNLVVVELFTSQGCSSCPPADELVGQLAEREDVLTLALHVDYWDYIGWKDIFADPAHTERQKGYARAAGGSTIYTPQMIIGGEDHVVGYKPMEVADLIAAHRARVPGAELSVSGSGERFTITANGGGQAARDLVVQVVRYLPEQSVSIRRGENAGRTITYHNIVQGWDVIGTWNGRGTFNRTVTVSGDDPLAVIVQVADQGPVVAAARLR